MFPGVQRLLVGKTEDDLEFIVLGRWCEHARTQVAGKVGRQLFAFAQPGDQILIASIGDAAGNHQGDG
ncbi:hypothetical protein D3C84_1238410 [compost metagenome]